MLESSSSIQIHTSPWGKGERGGGGKEERERRKGGGRREGRKGKGKNGWGRRGGKVRGERREVRRNRRKRRKRRERLKTRSRPNVYACNRKMEAVSLPLVHSHLWWGSQRTPQWTDIFQPASQPPAPQCPSYHSPSAHELGFSGQRENERVTTLVFPIMTIRHEIDQHIQTSQRNIDYKLAWCNKHY